MKKIKAPGQPKSVIFNIKVSPLERKRLIMQAKKYANGNLSAWLRYAGTYYRPSKTELIKQVC
jgi:hypothetical protein